MSGGLSRRGIMKVAAAAPLAAVAGGSAAALPRPAPAIDVHHHIVPDFYKPAMEPWLRRNASNVPDVLGWTVEGSLAAMDRAGVASAITSISAPGVSLSGVADAPLLARRCNDFAAAMARDHPGRFRFFTALPMPDVAASIREVERGYDDLGAVGVGLLSNYDGRYLGDPAFAPLFALLERRRAIVYVHPTTSPCCQGILPGVLDALIEFPVDTARTVASLLWAGVLSRHPGIRFIFSHGGGVLPMVAERIAAAGFINPALAARVPEGPLAALAKLYVDTASVANPIAFAALRAWLPAGHVMFGTDFPWGAPDRALAGLGRLELSAADLDAVRSGNATALLATAGGQAVR